uniref:Uncharacterized protein n=1 Tax=Molossus molossus TaxID=27622 RepID=A0A7J8I026_MOLMO|nr:hypothetical protein HJG59_010878 [Molossus molossus]
MGFVEVRQWPSWPSLLPTGHRNLTGFTQIKPNSSTSPGSCSMLDGSTCFNLAHNSLPCELFSTTLSLSHPHLSTQTIQKTIAFTVLTFFEQLLRYVRVGYFSDHVCNNHYYRNENRCQNVLFTQYIPRLFFLIFNF